MIRSESIGVTSCPEELQPALETWQGINLLYSRITRRLAADLDKTGGLSLATYEILALIADAGGQLRLKELQGSILLSQPGLSRKIERLEQDGLVSRGTHPSDGRAVLVALTVDGRIALGAAAHVHVAGIDRYFRANLSVEETQAIKGVFQKLLARLDG